MSNDAKYDEGNDLLYNFKLHQCKWTTIFNEAYTVGGNLATILKECNNPRESYDTNERPVGTGTTLLHF